MNICYIVGGGEFDGFFDEIKENDLLLAADKGYQNLEKENIKPDYYIGDFDSAKEPNVENKIVLNPEKDDTDSSYAINFAIKKGYKNFVLYGGLGGRLSHTVANIALAFDLKKKGYDLVLKKKGITAFVIDKSIKVNLEDYKDIYVSIFSLSEETKNLTLKGLKYPLNNYNLKSSDPLGVSNESVEKDFEISFSSGYLLIIYENKNI